MEDMNCVFICVCFLPRDAMHKRGLCRHAVSVCPSVCLSRSYILSKRIKILSCIRWQSSLAACGHVGVATRASGVLFVTRRARAVAACAYRLSELSVINRQRSDVSEPVRISTCSF